MLRLTLLLALAGACAEPPAQDPGGSGAAGVREGFASTPAGWALATPAQRVQVDGRFGVRLSAVGADASIELRTVRVAQGGTRCGSSAAPRVRAGQLVRSHDCGGEEILARSGEAIEQRWTFDGSAADEGALRVVVDVEGGHYVGRSEQGLVFERAGRRFVYGHGSWIDAAGRTTAVEARYRHRRIHLTVPEEVVFASQWPAVLDPIIGVARETDAPIVIDSDHSIDAVDVVEHSDLTLVGWQEYRDRETVRVGRVDASGSALDPYGIVVAEGTGLQAFALAATTDAFLVFWGDRQSSSLQYLRARRVGRDGVLGPVIDIGTTRPTRELSVASDGTDAYFTWVDSFTVWGTTLSAAGVVGTPAEVGPGSEPDVAWDGTDYRVAWQYARDSVWTLRVDSAGAVMNDTLEKLGEDLSYDLRWPVVSAGPSGALVAWEQTLPSLERDIYGAFIDAAGSPSAAEPLVELPSDQYEPSVGWDGSRHWLTWRDDRVDGSGDYVVPALQFDSTGTPRTTEPVDLATGWVGLPAITSSADPDLVYLSEVGLTLRRMDSATGLPSGSPIRVLQMANTQRWADLVAGDGEYLAVWLDHRPPRGIYGVFYGADGVPTGPVFPIDTNEEDYNPRVGFDGTRYLVTWNRRSDTEPTGIYGARLEADGTVLDVGGRQLFTPTGSTTTGPISHDGDHWLVTWQDLRAGGRFYDCYMGRYDASLTALDGTGVPITDNQRCSYVSGATAITGMHFVQWRLFIPGSARIGIRGSRVDDGVLVDAADGGLDVGDDQPLGVATDGTVFASAAILSDDNYQVFLVDPTTGDLSYTIALSGPPRGNPGEMTYDGSRFLTVARQPDHIEGVAFDADAVIVDAPFVIDDLGRYGPSLRVASLGAGSSLALYQRFVRGAPYETHRLFARLIGGDPLPAGASCGAADACVSGFCVDGVCCDAACGDSTPDDCQGCSVAVGAATDGTCGPIAAGTACGEGTTCSGTPSCDGAGVCMEATPLDCDDGDECTADSCVDPGGCEHTPVTGCGTDAGTPADGGTVADGGAPDAGASAPSDLGVPVDAFVAADAGPPPSSGDGCGCRTVPARSAAGWPLPVFLFLGCWLLSRRRGSGRCGSSSRAPGGS